MHIALQPGRWRLRLCVAYLSLLSVGFVRGLGLLALCMLFCFSTAWMRRLISQTELAAQHLNWSESMQISWSWALGPVLLLKVDGVRYSILRDEVSCEQWAALRRDVYLL